MNKNQLWSFVNRNGDFVFPEPQRISRLYFPLANEQEFMSSITPQLQGDIKIGQNQFLLQPVTSEDLYNNKTNRNFWIYFDKNHIWSLGGSSCYQPKDVKVTLYAGILWHTIKKISKNFGLEVEITTFVPTSNEKAELMHIKITNISDTAINFTPTSAIPIFGRSADNLRDHRHCTSLLHRINITKYGIAVKPVMSFDERGHKINHFSYFILGCEGNKQPPLGVFPTVESFIGEGNCLKTPQAVINNLPALKKAGKIHQGKEAMGALRFKTKTLIPDESADYILVLGIAEKDSQISQTFKKFNHKEKISVALSENIDFWKNKIDSISFCTADNLWDNWLRWVTLQPILRKIFGCSFLPDFDYGRGGKGWRDLWQDCLTFIFIHPKKTRKILKDNFSGVRIDGTNATIITKKPGYFIADRNKITRVWMDHGIWPYFTLQLYIHQTGDFDILFDNQTYFYDQRLCRGQETDHDWNPHYKHSKHLHTKDGHLYRGTILEHILVQHLTSFFNVGVHNNIKLEDADWNDGLDMAKDGGESVAFSCFYARNLHELTLLLIELKSRKKVKEIFLAKEILILLDTLRTHAIDYNNPSEKQALLERYFKSVKYRINGKKAAVKIEDLTQDLSLKWQWMFEHLRKKEWVQISKKIGFFNGYYDNRTKRVEGKFKGKVRMTLTGQVFPIFSGVASTHQVRQIFRAASKFLKDKRFGSFRLNTNFKGPQFDLGRAFAFSYGDKENGAVFSHMCIMFANALYKRGFAKEGYQVLKSLFEIATNTRISKIYPCLPEYFNLEGRGMYSYLTGSASWYLMTMLSEVYGINGNFGDLLISPKLIGEQFNNSHTISLACYFAERRISLIYKNARKIDYGKYSITKVTISPKQIPYKQISPNQIKIKRKHLLALAQNSHTTIEIVLD
ncbi:MAG: cellobiose phosphorylase [Candidatus Omnitrophota bacterium]